MINIQKSDWNIIKQQAIEAEGHLKNYGLREQAGAPVGYIVPITKAGMVRTNNGLKIDTLKQNFQFRSL